MKNYELIPHSDELWLAPGEVAARWSNVFDTLVIDEDAARVEAELQIQRYEALRAAGLGDESSISFAELQERWCGALAIIAATDRGERVRSIVRNRMPLTLEFGPEVVGRRRKPIAALAAEVGCPHFLIHGYEGTGWGIGTGSL